MLDVYSIRKDFPILNRKVNGNNLIYVDNAATTHKPLQVLDAIKEFYIKHYANVHRGIHKLSQEASDLYESARLHVANLINAEPEEIVFVKNATEGVNLVAYGWGMINLDRGDTVLHTLMDHHATIVPFYIVSKYRGFRQKMVGITDDGYIDMGVYEDLLSLNPRLFTFPHVSNMLSTVNDAKKLIKMAHRYGALVLLDATQSIPHMKVDVKDLDVDFMVFSAHKMCGPTGVGVVYIKKDHYQSMNPFLGGGDMIRDVGYNEYFEPIVKYNDVPVMYEAGTQNIVGISVYPKSIEYLEKISFDYIHEHIKRLGWETYEALREMKGIRLYGPDTYRDRAGIISFNVDGFSAHEVAAYLDSLGIAVRSGHHCTGPLHKRLGIPSSARISYYIYNTHEEVEYIVDSLGRLIQ